VIGQTSKLGADISARGLYRRVSSEIGSRNAVARTDERQSGLDPTAVAVRQLTHRGLYRAAIIEF